MYRMIVADLDGTLKSESNPSFSPRVLFAIKRAQERGVRIVMATGRMFRTAEPFIRKLGLEFAVCDHGATIYDLSSAKTIFEKRVSLELTREVAAFANGNLTLTACADGELYTNRIDPDTAKESYAVGHLHHVPDFLKVAIEPQKLLFLNDEPTTDQVFPEIKSRFGERMQVVRASTRRVELTDRATSKGISAAWLAARWGIPREQTIGIGDQDNDRSLIAWAGLGVAMGNAIADLKALAQFVAPSVDEDGAAAVIERFVLET